MKITTISASLAKRTGFVLMILALIFVSYAGRCFAQRRETKRVSPEVEIKVLSAVATRFEKPIRIGPPKRSIEYREALVLTLEVDREAFDSLPPDMEPFLYIGRNEYHIFAVDRQDQRRTLILTFHIRNWTQLSDQSAMILTIDHGAPLRNPELFERRQGPRFDKASIRDGRL